MRRRRLSKSERLLLLNNQNCCCFYCGIKLRSALIGDRDDFNRSPNWACVDHKIPFCDGGDTDEINCVMACRTCNAKKGVKHYTGGGHENSHYTA